MSAEVAQSALSLTDEQIDAHATRTDELYAKYSGADLNKQWARTFARAVLSQVPRQGDAEPTCQHNSSSASLTGWRCNYCRADVPVSSVPAAGEGVGMPVTQEPKYGIRENRLFNRASGEFIPADEPVFIFRARDKYAASIIGDYAAQFCSNEQHQAAVEGRFIQFSDWSSQHPGRMKEPDTASLSQPTIKNPASVSRNLRATEFEPKQEGPSELCELDRTAPPAIWLQISDDDSHFHEPFPPNTGDVTWCAGSQIECEVKYIRADLALTRPQPVAPVQEILTWAERCGFDPDASDKWMKAEMQAEINDLRAALAARQAGPVTPTRPVAPEQQRSPTSGMDLGQRIEHVGGRVKDNWYVEFGSPMAVNALIHHVLRDLPSSASPAAQPVPDDRDVEIARLNALINNPQTAEFLDSVKAEAAHQRDKWGDAHDRGKSAENWFWLVGYLAGKCLRAVITGDKHKALHHTISSGAALANWYEAIKRDETDCGIGHDNDIKPIEIARLEDAAPLKGGAA